MRTVGIQGTGRGTVGHWGGFGGSGAFLVGVRTVESQGTGRGTVGHWGGFGGSGAFRFCFKFETTGRGPFLPIICERRMRALPAEAENVTQKGSGSVLDGLKVLQDRQRSNLGSLIIGDLEFWFCNPNSISSGPTFVCLCVFNFFLFLQPPQMQ